MSKLNKLISDIVEKQLLIEEAKDHIIRKIPSLTSSQKSELIDLFKSKPHLEREVEIDWSNYRKLEWEDFSDAINYESGREKKKKSKSGIRGLKIDTDYVPLKTIDVPEVDGAYIPLNWEASKTIASKNVGDCHGKWCTASYNSSSDWNRYVHKDKIVMVYLITNDAKYGLAVYPGNFIWELFDHNNNPIREIPGMSEDDIDDLVEDNKNQLDNVRNHLTSDSGIPIDVQGGFDGVRHKINADGSVDVYGSVKLSSKELTELPIKYNKVDGDFDIYNNNLTTLEGCPKEVMGNFNCKDNPTLTSLEGCPETIGGDFSCGSTSLRDLSGGPISLGGGFDAVRCGLLSLEGSPHTVNGVFRAVGNKLTTLDGGPKEVTGNYMVQNNKLVSLQGAPNTVGGKFVCTRNPTTFTIDEVSGGTVVRGDIKV